MTLPPECIRLSSDLRCCPTERRLTGFQKQCSLRRCSAESSKPRGRLQRTVNQTVLRNYVFHSEMLNEAKSNHKYCSKCPPSASTQADKRRLHSLMAWFTTDWFSSHHTVRCAHKSGYVINFITVACRIYSRLKRYKNYKNRLRLAKVIVKNKMSRFYGSLCS